ncbi:MAG TPA: PspC domain-containing protein [Gaiellaceae bacterium]
MTETTSYRQLRRSRSDRMLAGVCGGLGDYFEVNPLFYRIGFVVLTFLGGSGFLIYGAALLVIPDERAKDSIAADALRNHRRRPGALIGLLLVGAAGIALLSHISYHLHSEVFWTIVLLGGVLILASHYRGRELSAAPTATTEADGEEATTMITTQRRSRRRLRYILLATGLLLLIPLVAGIVFASVYAHLGDGIGNRSYQPLSAAARTDYRVGIGNLRLDLSRAALPATQTRIHAHIGIGHLELVVPQGMTVRINSHVAWGGADVLGYQEGGHDVTDDVGSNAAPLVIDADVGIGQIDVHRVLP